MKLSGESAACQFASDPDPGNRGELLHKLSTDVEAQRELTREVLAVYEKAVGKKAKGWLSSSLRGTPEAIDICAEEGLIYYCDLMNDDQLYLIETPSGLIVSVPYVIEINDFSLFSRRGLTGWRRSRSSSTCSTRNTDAPGRS